MEKLIQMVYISRANSIFSDSNGGMPAEVSNILRKSRRNNRAKNIVGALYFGNGCFFQCLEGDERDLMSLYKVLESDTRHHDLRIILKKPIQQRSFGNWEMKYVPSGQEIENLLSSFGMNSFDPYQFSEPMIDKMLELLLKDAKQNRAYSVPESDQKFEKKSGEGCIKWKVITAIVTLLLAVDLLRQLLH